MPKKLVLCEKPSQGRDIAAGLGESFSKAEGCMESSHYVVTWGFGHLIELEPPDAYDERYKKWTIEDLPINPSQFKYRVSNDGNKQFRTIKGLVGRSDIDSVVIATDPGREGELIARLILMMAGNRKPIYRFWTSEALSEDVVQREFQRLRRGEEFDRLYHAALARQQGDWLIGMNATRAYSVKFNARPPLSLGRVQTPTLALLVQRELEIKSFKPEDSWILKARFRHKGGEYEGLWVPSTAVHETEQKPADADEDRVSEEDASSRFRSEAQARQACGRIDGKSGVIASCEQKVKEEGAYLLFSLTVLQQECNRLFGFTADKTLEIAQSLYEGKYTSYPRTESQYLDENMPEKVQEILHKLKNYRGVAFDAGKCTVNPKNKRVFDNSKLTDHYALIPTGKLPGDGLDENERKVYELVVRRFIAAFYPHFKYRTTTVITAVGQDHFKTMGKAVISLGWREIYGGADKDQLLPDLKAKDPVQVVKVETEKKQTAPPPRYTDASILKAMTNAARFVTEPELRKILKETAGIGTTATRAAILQTLKDREYIIRKGKSIVPTERGISLILALQGEPLANVGYTALWEQELDNIASGKVVSSQMFMQNIRRYAAQIIEKVKTTSAQIAASGKGGEALGNCPACGKPVVEREKSYSCTGWKEGCKFTLWKTCLEKLGKKTIPVGAVKTMLAGKQAKLSGLKSTKTGKEFDAHGKLARDPERGWKVELVFEKK